MTTADRAHRLILPARSRIAICSSCDTYLGEEAKGEECPEVGCGHKLRLRVGYICDCEEGFFFPTSAAYLEHQKEEINGN